MLQEVIPDRSFVIRALDIPATRHLSPAHPQPIAAQWINRATDRALRPTTVNQLARTLCREDMSPSIRKLEEEAGLRTTFRNSRDRNNFAGMFRQAIRAELAERQHVVTAIGRDHANARDAAAFLLMQGLPAESVCLLEQASQLHEPGRRWPRGFRKAEVAGLTAGSGILGAMLGVALLAIPGVGVVSISAALASTAFPAFATISGVIGATGGAMATMLSDFDVDGNATRYFADQIRNGAIAITVDTRDCRLSVKEVEQVFMTFGLSIARRPWLLRHPAQAACATPVIKSPAAIATP